MVRVSSAVMVDVNGVTTNSVGSPGVTVIVWIPQTSPKQDEMDTVPIRSGVNNPLLPMLPEEAAHDIGGAWTIAW